MAKVCQVTGKRPQSGHNVSHANNKTKRKFGVNLHTKRIWDEEKECFVKMRVSANGMRTINKKGLAAVQKDKKARSK